jgi:hypothetical protein
MRRIFSRNSWELFLKRNHFSASDRYAVRRMNGPIVIYDPPPRGPVGLLDAFHEPNFTEHNAPAG